MSKKSKNKKKYIKALVRESAADRSLPDDFPTISFYSPVHEDNDDGFPVDESIDNEIRLDEIRSGKNATRLVNTIMSTTSGFSDDKMFIAAEQVLLKAFVGFLYIWGNDLLDLSELPDVLYATEPDDFSEDYYRKNPYDVLFERAEKRYPNNFACKNYSFIRRMIFANPKLCGVFISCAKRIERIKDFITVYKEIKDFQFEQMDEEETLCGW